METPVFPVLLQHHDLHVFILYSLKAVDGFHLLFATVVYAKSNFHPKRIRCVAISFITSRLSLGGFVRTHLCCTLSEAILVYILWNKVPSRSTPKTCLLSGTAGTLFDNVFIGYNALRTTDLSSEYV
jgi:hypothetical protein